MIKKIATIIMLSAIIGTSLAAFEIPGKSTIYTTDQAQVINTVGITDPIRDGAFKVVNNGSQEISGIVSSDTQITSHKTAESKTLSIIKNIINYALGLVSLVALVYLIYHGIMILTAAGDETKYKDGLKGIKFAAIALAGIGLSWLIISSIFYIINGMINNAF